jgi:methionyl-tRNA formyltransferase
MSNQNSQNSQKADKLDIAFFGTSDRPKPILESLNNNFNLTLCVTKTDRVVGRHQEKRETLVKIWAKEHKVDVFEVENIKEQEKPLLNVLSKKNIDLIIVADFGFIITSKIIEKYKDKLINIHFSLLPKYRGANPVQATIINGDGKTGISFFLMRKGMDTGPVIAQVPYDLVGNETTEILFGKLFELAAEHLPKVIREYSNGKITPKEQDESKATYYYSPSHPRSTYIYKEDARINWEESVEQIERKIRAFNPWPIAWTTLKEIEQNQKVYVSDNEKALSFREGVDLSLRFKIFSARIKKGKLLPQEVQVSGKKKTSWENFKNGYTN